MSLVKAPPIGTVGAPPRAQSGRCECTIRRRLGRASARPSSGTGYVTPSRTFGARGAPCGFRTALENVPDGANAPSGREVAELLDTLASLGHARRLDDGRYLSG